jgi:hypothetical protein
MRAEASWRYSLQNYIESRGSFELAVAFGNLFWPDFLEHKGCILRADVFDEENFERWWREKNGDTKAIECALNLVHVEELVPSDTTQLDEGVYKYLCQTLAETWLARVTSLYPDRQFVVSCTGCDDAEPEGGPTVYLYQKS